MISIYLKILCNTKEKYYQIVQGEPAMAPEDFRVGRDPPLAPPLQLAFFSSWTVDTILTRRNDLLQSNIDEQI